MADPIFGGACGDSASVSDGSRRFIPRSEFIGCEDSIISLTSLHDRYGKWAIEVVIVYDRINNLVTTCRTNWRKPVAVPLFMPAAGIGATAKLSPGASFPEIVHALIADCEMMMDVVDFILTRSTFN